MDEEVRLTLGTTTPLASPRSRDASDLGNEAGANIVGITTLTNEMPQERETKILVCPVEPVQTMEQVVLLAMREAQIQLSVFIPDRIRERTSPIRHRQ